MTNFTILTYSFLLTFLFVSKIYFCSDTWSTLTEVLGNYLWGDNARAQPSSNQTQRAADITEQFETLYSRAAAEAEEDVRPVAMSVIMSTCSRYFGFLSIKN